MAAVSELLADIDRQPTLEECGEFFRVEMPFRARDLTTYAGAVTFASEITRKLRRIVDLCDGPENASEFLLGLTQGIKPVPSNGDHFHWPLYLDEPKRKGVLVSISKIGPRSNENPEPHKHPEDLQEILFAVGEGLTSIVTITDEHGEQKLRHEIEPLTPYFVPRGVMHSDYNADPETKVVYLIYRVRISPDDPSHPYQKWLQLPPKPVL